jgi:parallel beta-helix repeat protein
MSRALTTPARARLCRAFALACLALLAPGAWATDFIDCSAVANGTGTFASPWWGVSATKGDNSTSNINETTISSNDDDILFKAGTTCDNSQLGGTGGFPNGLGMAGSAGNYIRIGVYDPDTGEEILTPTSEQRVWLKGNGTTRTEMVSMFGYSFVVLNGFKCSGGSNSSGRGCISIGINGATPPTDIFVTNNEIVQGDSPTNTANMYGIVVAGTGSGATGARVTISGNTISGLRGTSTNVGILCSNMDSCIIDGNYIDASGGSGLFDGGVWTRSTIDARAVSSDHVVTDNTIIGGRIGIRHNFDYTLGATLPYLNRATISRNVLTNQTLQGISLGFTRESLIEGNTITGAGLASGDGSGIAISGLSAYVGASDTMGTRIAGNTITDSGKFAVWLLGISKAVVEDNIISGCGFSGSVYSRCIELTTRDSSVETLAQTLTLSALSGAGVTATAGGGTPFVTADLEKIITGPLHNGGALRITAINSPTQVTGTVIVPFLDLNIAASIWGWEVLSCENTIRGNIVSGAVADFSNGGGTEGLGIGLDDLTCASVVERNFVSGNSFYGIESNNGHGNIIRNNILHKNGTGSDGGAERSVRKSQINIKGSSAAVYGNSINCDGSAYGIAAENSQTANPLGGPLDAVANGGASTYRNNVIVNCSIAAIVGNANDSANNNAFHGNALNYVWMPKLIYSSSPTVGDLTAQTLDGASLTSDPKFVGGANPQTPWQFSLSASSRLPGSGDTCADNDFFGDPFYVACDIGAIRRDQCYRRAPDGALSKSRFKSQVISRCNGVPGRYPEGM